MTSNPSLRLLSPGGRATRLLCFPYAGAGASVFREWANLVPEQVEVWAVQLPGREDRFGEPPLTDLDDVLNDLVPAVLPLLDRPYAFFGHSLGALVCWELARACQALQTRPPEHVFLSGYRAPRPAGEDDGEPLHALPDDELVEELREMGGTPEDVLRNPELMRLLLPLLRADLAISETRVLRPGEPLTCPVTAFGGRDDPRAGSDDLDGWADHVAGTFAAEVFPGDHFYLHEQRSALVTRVVPALVEPAARARPAG